MQSISPQPVLTKSYLRPKHLKEIFKSGTVCQVELSNLIAPAEE